MIIKSLCNLIVLIYLACIKAKDLEDVEILGIEPNSGPVYGETRVLVRIKEFDVNLIEDFPHPKVIYFFI